MIAPAGIDGRSLLPLGKGREVIFGAYRDVQRCVRTDRWKLIRYTQINKSQLFEIANDPDETKDLAAEKEYARTLDEMTELLKKQQTVFGDTLPLSTDKPAPLQVELKNEPPKQ